jgi:hypothetical protein
MTFDTGERPALWEFVTPELEPAKGKGKGKGKGTGKPRASRVVVGAVNYDGPIDYEEFNSLSDDDAFDSLSDDDGYDGPLMELATHNTSNQAQGNKRKKGNANATDDDDDEKPSKRRKSVGKGNAGHGTTDEVADDELMPTPREYLTKRPPYEYYCMPRPLYDVTTEAHAKVDLYDESTMVDEFAIRRQYNKDQGNNEGPGLDPLAEWPEHKWFGMWNTWCTIADMHRFTTYRDPDNFGMYVCNDFYGYGFRR